MNRVFAEALKHWVPLGGATLYQDSTGTRTSLHVKAWRVMRLPCTYSAEGWLDGPIGRISSSMSDTSFSSKGDAVHPMSGAVFLVFNAGPCLLHVSLSTCMEFNRVHPGNDEAEPFES